MSYLFGAAGSGGGGGGGAVTAQNRWKADAITTLLSTELNNLAGSTGSSLGTEYDNSTNLNKWGDFELFVVMAVAPTADLTVDLYLIPCPDGTNYADGGTSVQPVNFGRGQFSVRNVTTMRLVIHMVALPPMKFKIFVVNNTNQAFSASGNTVRMVPYREQLGT